MVGVAGKSQACHDCRRRRIKCDLGRPTCLRCQKSGIICSGYDKALIFVHQSQANPKANAAATISELRRGRDLKSSLRSSTYDIDLNSIASQVTKPSYPTGEFRHHALQLLKKLYLPQPDQLTEGENTIWMTYSWVNYVCDLKEPNDALDHALHTFCAIQVCVTHTGQSTKEESLSSYNVALQRLWNKLEDPKASYTDETLAAIVVLSTCELFLFSSDDAWRAHASGVSTILRLRGPSEKPTRIFQSLCARLRLICVLLAMAIRRTPFLTASEWRQIVPTRSKSQKIDDLVDIMSAVSTLLEESDLLIASTLTDAEFLEYWRGNILRSHLSIFKELSALQLQIRESRPSQFYWAVPSSLDNPADNKFQTKLMPFSLEFDSLDTAVMFTLSWSVMLQILSNVISLYNHFFGDFTDPPSLRDALRDNRQGLNFPHESTETGLFLGLGDISIESVKQTADQLARYLCQSIEYFHRVEMGIFGLQSTCFLQWSLRKYFRNHAGHERELDWVLSIKNMGGSGFHFGIDIMTFND